MLQQLVEYFSQFVTDKTPASSLVTKQNILRWAEYYHLSIPTEQVEEYYQAIYAEVLFIHLAYRFINKTGANQLPSLQMWTLFLTYAKSRFDKPELVIELASKPQNKQRICQIFNLDFDQLEYSLNNMLSSLLPINATCSLPRIDSNFLKKILVGITHNSSLSYHILYKADNSNNYYIELFYKTDRNKLTALKLPVIIDTDGSVYTYKEEKYLISQYIGYVTILKIKSGAQFIEYKIKIDETYGWFAASPCGKYYYPIIHKFFNQLIIAKYPVRKQEIEPFHIKCKEKIQKALTSPLTNLKDAHTVFAAYFARINKINLSEQEKNLVKYYLLRDILIDDTKTKTVPSYFFELCQLLGVYHPTKIPWHTMVIIEEIILPMDSYIENIIHSWYYYAYKRLAQGDDFFNVLLPILQNEDKSYSLRAHIQQYLSSELGKVSNHTELSLFNNFVCLVLQATNQQKNFIIPALFAACQINIWQPQQNNTRKMTAIRHSKSTVFSSVRERLSSNEVTTSEPYAQQAKLLPSPPRCHSV